MYVDSLSVAPKYYRLSETLRQKIDSNEWQPHGLLPSERELETLYGVSRTTVRQALNHLANQGYIYREHGRGTFVARPKMQHSLHFLRSFTNDIKDRGFRADQRILRLDYIRPSKRVRKKLELLPQVEQVAVIERLRYADNEPIGIHIAYILLASGQMIAQEDILAFGSLYALLEAKFNLIPTDADETIEATIADKHEADLLKIKVGSPLLLLERTTFSQRHRPMEFVKMLYRADRYKYHLHITR